MCGFTEVTISVSCTSDRETMPTTRSRALCGSTGSQEELSQRCDRSHMRVITSLKCELLELQNTLELERKRRCELEAWESELVFAKPDDVSGDGHRESCLSDHLATDLELCKKELEATRQVLDEACEEREALRAELSMMKNTTVTQHKDTEKQTGETVPRLDWVGRHYLAVTLPEDHMFKPGESVTPAGVLHKLYEIRVGSRLATGFTVLLENINIMLSHTDPRWYAKHFGFRSGTRTHGNNYMSVDRIDTEEFAWLLFEYGGHAPLIEVLAGLQNMLSSSGKGGVTTSPCTPRTSPCSEIRCPRLSSDSSSCVKGLTRSAKSKVSCSCLSQQDCVTMLKPNPLPRLSEVELCGQ